MRGGCGLYVRQFVLAPCSALLQVQPCSNLGRIPSPAGLVRDSGSTKNLRVRPELPNH